MRSIGSVRNASEISVGLFLAVALFVLTAASRTMAQTPAAPPSVAGTVTSSSGNVQLQRAGSSGGAGTGASVYVGDRIISGPGGHAVITLTDGSRLELGESSNLTIDSHGLTPAGGRAATSVSLFSGIVRSIVSATGGAPSFEVHTPNAVASVRGTRWDTAYTDGETRATYGDCRKFTDVAVYDGLVGVRNPSNAAAGGVDVPAGYEVTVPCDQGATLPGPVGMTGAAGIAGAAAAISAGAGGGVPPPACPVCPPGR